MIFDYAGNRPPFAFSIIIVMADDVGEILNTSVYLLGFFLVEYVLAIFVSRPLNISRIVRSGCGRNVELRRV